MWNHELADLEQDGAIRQIGVVLEQHPDRARLFAQWQQIGWPIYADAMDLLDLEVVPRSFLLDAQGCIAAVNPNAAEVRSFVASLTSAGLVDVDPPGDLSFVSGAGEFLKGEIAKAVESLREELRSASDFGRTRFRLGVARMALAERADAPAGLFATALEDWRLALAQNPSQYVWRRRIQQYGPRLDKPYPFYDWVVTAREEIRARGEEPTAIRVEPAGAELAQPRREGGATETTTAVEPDPDRKLPPIPAGCMRLEHAVVAGTQEQPVVRVHVLLTPVADAATWNDEGEPAEAWIHAPEGWELVDGPSARIVAPTEGGDEGSTRRLEFELRRSGKAEVIVGAVAGYLLLDLCLTPDGTCVRMRLDFRLTMP